MRLLGVWIEGLMLISDGDEAGNEVILGHFFLYLLDKSEIAVVDHYVILVFDEEVIKCRNDIDYFISFGLVQALGGGFEIGHHSEADLALLLIAENAGSVGVSPLFLLEVNHEYGEERFVLILQLYEDLLLCVLHFLAFGNQWHLHEVSIGEDEGEGHHMQEVHYFLELGMLCQ